MKSKASQSLFKVSQTKIANMIIGFAFSKGSALLPVKRVKENEKVIAFWHPKPSWEKHIVIVPKKPIKNLPSIQNSDYEYVAEALKIAGEIAEELHWQEKRYSVLIHGGTGQSVKQLHFHLNSGKLLHKS